MPRTIFLLSYPAIHGARHWGIFIPHAEDLKIGKEIHVVGSPFRGYTLEFKRNYDPSKTNRKVELTPLGLVQDDCVVNVNEGGTLSLDTIAQDTLEMEAKTIPAIGVSKNPLDPAAENCQMWLWRYLELLVSKGLVAAAALEVLKNAKTTGR